MKFEVPRNYYLKLIFVLVGIEVNLESRPDHRRRHGLKEEVWALFSDRDGTGIRDFDLVWHWRVPRHCEHVSPFLGLPVSHQRGKSSRIMNYDLPSVSFH